MGIDETLAVMKKVQTAFPNCKFTVKQSNDEYGDPDYEMSFIVYSTAFELEKLLIADKLKDHGPL